jgi:translation initiation factor IF-2
MNDTKNPGDKTLHVPSKTLSLKRPVEQGVVRQSFSHGRSKAVVVEKVKRRIITPGEAKAEPAAVAPAAAPVAPRVPTPSAAAPAPAAAAPVARPVPPAAPVAPAPQPVMTEQVAPQPQPAPAPVEAAPVAAEQPAPPPVMAAKPVAQPAAPAAAQPAPRPASAQPAGSSRVAPPVRTGGIPPRSGQQPQRGAAPSGRGAPSGGQRPSGVVLRTLTDEERDARLQALAGAKVREEEDRKRAEQEALLRNEREARAAQERAEAEARKREEEERHRRETEVRKRSEEEAKRRLGDQPEPARAGATSARPAGARPAPSATADAGFDRTVPRRPGVPVEFDDDDANRRRRAGAAGGPARPAAPAKPERARAGDDKRRGRLTLSTVTGDSEERVRSVAAFRRRVQRLKGNQVAETKEKIAREVTVPETITIQELANRMSERAVDVIRFLMKQGQMAKITDVIDADTAQLVAEELGHTVKRVAESDVEEGLFDEADAVDDLITRAPVVTIMGHVDHGKTSLLDALRKANVAGGEAGGITQHIGAYQVTSPLGEKITFIDTPGHAAFSAMRARGAKVTDIVILVVAADDGVMPQTIEAISHARAAGVPIIVAINKIDKPNANPERVRTELLQYEVQVESMGGETLEIEVSAKERRNLDKLLEAITLQAEVLDLRANPKRSGEGTVIEAKLDRGRGPVATVLVQRGTLHAGDIVVAGAEWGRVRALVSDSGKQVQDAGPSVPVEILGFNGAPDAGDRVVAVENEARAREITEYRQRQRRDRIAARAGSARGSLADMMNQLKSGGRKDYTLIVKGDVQGSVEAIIGALDKLGNEEVGARVMHSGVGGINESDITLAEATGAIVIGFNVRANKEAREAAERAGIEIRYYSIIYDLVDDMKEAMSGMLAPTLREERIGEARILQVFAVSKIGKVAGCLITEGRVERGAHVRLIRGDVVVHEGKLSSLKRFKDEVKDVPSGQECGLAFENNQDMREGDIIECFRVESIRRSL